MSNEGEGDQVPGIKILEYAYTTLKQVGYQSLVDTLQAMLDSQINEENVNKLTFEITPETEDDNPVSAVNVSVKSDEIKDRISELQELLRRKAKKETDEPHDDWQMTVEVPTGVTVEHLESNMNTDNLLSYVITDNWINHYGENYQFLYDREEVCAELVQVTTSDEESSQQIKMRFFDRPKPEPSVHEEAEAEGEAAITEPQETEDSNFMKSQAKTTRKNFHELQVPHKYDNIRKPPQEVPQDVIKKLFLAIDQDLDDRITAYEIKKYMKRVRLSLGDEIADQLIKEITDRRSVIHERQRHLPIAFEEV